MRIYLNRIVQKFMGNLNGILGFSDEAAPKAGKPGDSKQKAV